MEKMEKKLSKVASFILLLAQLLRNINQSPDQTGPDLTGLDLTGLSSDYHWLLNFSFARSLTSLDFASHSRYDFGAYSHNNHKSQEEKHKSPLFRFSVYSLFLSQRVQLASLHTWNLYVYLYEQAKERRNEGMKTCKYTTSPGNWNDELLQVVSR